MFKQSVSESVAIGPCVRTIKLVPLGVASLQITNIMRMPPRDHAQRYARF